MDVEPLQGMGGTRAFAIECRMEYSQSLATDDTKSLEAKRFLKQTSAGPSSPIPINVRSWMPVK